MNINCLYNYLGIITEEDIVDFRSKNEKGKINFLDNIIKKTNLSLREPFVLNYESMKLYFFIKYGVIQLSENKFSVYCCGDIHQGYSVASSSRKTLTLPKLEKLFIDIWVYMIKKHLNVKGYRENLLPNHLYHLMSVNLKKLMTETEYGAKYRILAAKSKCNKLRLYHSTDMYTDRYPPADKCIELNYEYLGAMTMEMGKETYVLSTKSSKTDMIFYHIISMVKEWVIGLLIADHKDIINNTFVPSMFIPEPDQYHVRIHKLSSSSIRFVRKEDIIIDKDIDENDVIDDMPSFEELRDNTYLYGMFDENIRVQLITELSDLVSHPYKNRTEVNSLLDSLNDYIILRYL